ncbi:MAG: formyltetrahydrofolate-dependent phosphoribosylglycinamide formyltransferase [Humibacillus sp.]|nr:formyltetrahydrofolate-dependent phosphoribosylglycinamide formyltransferase [Humibacillus sp.]
MVGARGWLVPTRRPARWAVLARLRRVTSETTDESRAATAGLAPTEGAPVEVLVLVSGSGTLLQALVDASADPGYGVRIAAVGADRPCEGLARAERAGIPTFVERPADHADRAAWDRALADRLAAVGPRFVVTAGFMRILGPATLAVAPVVNTHPALLPSFPGAHGVRDALAYGVKVTGTTCHVVDAGVDTGPIIEQRVVVVADDDTEESLHERIKQQERDLLVSVVPRLAREGLVVDGRRVRIAPA